MARLSRNLIAARSREAVAPGTTRTSGVRFRKLCNRGLRGSRSRLGPPWVAKLGKAWSYLDAGLEVARYDVGDVRHDHVEAACLEILPEGPRQIPAWVDQADPHPLGMPVQMPVEAVLSRRAGSREVMPGAAVQPLVAGGGEDGGPAEQAVEIG